MGITDTQLQLNISTRGSILRISRRRLVLGYASPSFSTHSRDYGLKSLHVVLFGPRRPLLAVC